MGRIIIITNTFPYVGETFLKTEIDLLPEGLSVLVFPLFPPENKDFCQHYNSNKVSVFPYKKNRNIINFIIAVINSLMKIFTKKELNKLLGNKGLFRNTLKAIKFAYISELRIIAIKHYINSQNLDSNNYVFYSYWMYEAAYIGARLKEHFNGSIFLTRCHGYDLYEERHINNYMPFRQFIFESADSIYPVSQKGSDYINTIYNEKYRNKITVARLGTIRNNEVYVSDKGTKPIRLVSCSNIIPLKRVDLIVKALSNASEEIVWTHFGDGVLRQEVENESKKLPSNVKAIFKGQVDNSDIQLYYSTHHITAFINVSETEGVPVSIMEAQSYAIPIIATDVGGTSELVHNGENGILLRNDFEPNELLGAINAIHNDQNAYRSNSLRTWEEMSDATKTVPYFYNMVLKLEDK